MSCQRNTDRVRPTTKRIAIASVVLFSWLIAANRLSAQSCSSLPLSPNEMWLAVGVLHEEGTPWNEVAFEASPGNRFAISLRRITGGAEGAEDLQAWSALIGVPFSYGVTRFCPFLGAELNDFSFVNRFEVDRGEANYLSREIGLRVAVPVFSLDGVEMSAWAVPAIASLKFAVSGRTLIVKDQISSEELNFGATEWKFSGRVGLSLRWKALGISGGITRRPALSSGTLPFFRAGLAFLRGDSRKPGPP